MAHSQEQLTVLETALAKRDPTLVQRLIRR